MDLWKCYCGLIGNECLPSVKIQKVVEVVSTDFSQTREIEQLQQQQKLIFPLTRAIKLNKMDPQTVYSNTEVLQKCGKKLINKR